MDHLLSRSSLELRARVLQVEPADSVQSWSPTPQFSGAIAFGALPDIWIDEQDHRKVINPRANARLVTDRVAQFPSIIESQIWPARSWSG